MAATVQREDLFRVCPECGEDNPERFTSCWSCLAALDGAELARRAVAVAGPGVEPSGVPAALSVERRRALVHEVLAVLAIAYLPFVLFGIEGALHPSNEAYRSTLWGEVHGLAGSAGVIAIVIFVSSRGGRGRELLGFSGERLGRELLWGVGLALVTGLVYAGVVLATTWLGLPLGDGAPTEVTTAARWAAPVTLLAAATAEELLFRAWLWSRLARLLRSPLAALVISSAVFSVGHVYALPHSLGVFAVGLVMGASFWVSRRIERLVLAHWLYNLALSY